MNYTKVVISADVKEIPKGAFYNWTSLTQIIFEYPSQCTRIGKNAFYGCRSLQSIDFDLENEKLQIIESNAFGCCDSLQHVVIPEGVKVIQDMAFFGCDQLQNLELPTTSLEEIHQHGKKYSSVVFMLIFLVSTNILLTISLLLNFLKSTVFRGCSSLTHVTIPKTVYKIGEGAFAQCTSLQSIRLPRDLNRIEPALFLDCKSLTTVDYHPRNDESTTSRMKQSSKIHLPPKLLSIGDEAFSGCEKLGPTIILPNTIASIGSYAFENCFSLQEMMLSEATQMVGDGGFRNCHQLFSLTLRLDVEFGVAAFEGCTSLTELIDSDTDNIVYI